MADAPDLTAEYRRFRVHAADCTRCEWVRKQIARAPFATNFDAWHAGACQDGRLLLEQWKYACDVVAAQRQRQQSQGAVVSMRAP